MSDLDDDFRAWREYKKSRKEAYAKNADAAIKRVQLRGHQIVEISDGHFRCDDWIDWWPRTGTFMILGTKRKGRGTDALLKALNDKVFNP
jgi:hypothetical protein